jgi:type I restriction enzyme R subunit
VIVTTIQKLGLALDENSKRNKQQTKAGRATYREQLAPLSDQRIVFIFDECHRSQFGDNHQAIKAFFPKAQLFGFTGTPIFEANASAKQFEGDEGQFRTTEDLFQKQLHAYTITHAIEDANVLRFHVDYFKPEGPDPKNPPKPGEALAKKAIIEAILAKHDTATAGRRFNAVLATAASTTPSNTTACSTSCKPPGKRPTPALCRSTSPACSHRRPRAMPMSSRSRKTCPRKSWTTSKTPKAKKPPSKPLWPATTRATGTNHTLSEFDLYYQDVQKRIKDQQWPNADYPAAKKIDITIVVDMLLTGFDSKYLNTLYVDKNLKHHGLIQAFSRTNRVLNGTKPYGNILDFRQQQANVDAAIALFSGEKSGEQAREIWLVDKAPVVIEKLDAAVTRLADFMQSQGLPCTPEAVHQLKGDARQSRLHPELQGSAAPENPAGPVHRPDGRQRRRHRAHPARRAAARPFAARTSKPPSASRPSRRGPAMAKTATGPMWTSSTLSLCCSPAP